MAIHFIPNDPLAGALAPPMRRKRPASRGSTRAGFTFHDAEPARLYERGTTGFLYWQCREAALMAVSTWERHAGALQRWARNRSRLDVIQNAVRQRGQAQDLNAFYDRSSVTFFEFNDGRKTTYSGESTDVVAHEVGHALLDALRPDLWDVPYLEVNAFHEAFGDCMALLAALGDARSRSALLARGPGVRNFVETTAEDLSDGIRRVDPDHNAAAPRRALNRLRWQLPSSLPFDGGPGVLINESHSFAQVFTGCFWDLLRNLLGSGTSSRALDTATRTAAKLLVAGAREAPESTRFFQAVGRAMVLADGRLNGGRHHTQIRDAFAAHGIALGSNAMLAPVAALAGPSPAAARPAVTLSAATRRDLRDRLGATEKIVFQDRDIAGARFVHVMSRRDVPLAKLSPRLKGVFAVAPESVLIGGSGGRAAILGGMPQPAVTVEEVMTYVDSLVKHDRIEYGGNRRPASRERGRPAWRSHAVRPVGGRRVLARVCFSCGAPGLGTG